MNKNTKILISSCLVLILIISGLLILVSKNNKQDIGDNKNNSNEVINDSVDKDDNTIIKNCKTVLETNENAITNLVITYKVVDGIIMSATNNMIIECKTVDYYNSLKNYEDYAKTKKFNDENKTVSFKEGEDSDYSNLKIKYDEYKLDLEKNNYICD